MYLLRRGLVPGNAMDPREVSDLGGETGQRLMVEDYCGPGAIIPGILDS